MRIDKIVHFVHFETLLSSDDFLTRWEHYKRSANIDENVILQESKKGNVFSYIAEHHCDSYEFKFTFTKGAKLTRAKQAEIKTKQLGGYSVVQLENPGHAKRDDYKLFIFIDNSFPDLAVYKQNLPFGKLNIYKAYFENCSYSYILEYFIKSKDIPAFQENLKQLNESPPAVYKELVQQYS